MKHDANLFPASDKPLVLYAEQDNWQIIRICGNNISTDWSPTNVLLDFKLMNAIQLRILYPTLVQRLSIAVQQGNVISIVGGGGV